MALPNSFAQPIHPHQAVSTLILVENSQNMSNIWTDLRDRYLVKLVDSLVSSNQSVPITVSVLESCPCQDTGSNSVLPQQYSGYHNRLHELRFNYSQENRLSVALISNCVDMLISGKFQGQPAIRHIIIVAATTPFDEPGGHFSNNGSSPWSSLAQKFASNNIHCHIAVTVNQDMSSLKILFEETLHLQNNVEGNAPFPVDTNSILFKFSATPTHQHYADPRGTPYQPQAPLPRRNSYPLDSFYPESVQDLSSSITSLPGESDSSPTLVSQLQQRHGLIKKRVYGAKPTRQPFFREERVSDNYRSVPAPLTMPMSATEQISSPTAGGRVLSQSRADRMARVSQNSPTDLHPRRQFCWPRRDSPLSTPDADNMPSPPSSSHHDMSPPTYSSEFSSPVTPVMAIDDMYFPPGLPPQIQPGLQTPPLASYQTGGIPDPTWATQPQYNGGYSAPSQSYFPQYTLYSTNDQMVVDPQMQQQHQRSSHHPNGHSPYSPFITSPSTVPSQPPREAEPLVPTPPAPIKTAAHTKSNSRSKKSVPVDNDEQVTFSKDFVAATAALFEEEVLPSYPNFGPSSGLTSGADHEIPLIMPASRGGELYANRPKTRAALAKDASAKAKGNQPLSTSAPTYSYNQPIVGYNPSSLQYGSNYFPAGSSSLTGWAG